ncbi:hypothetical protein POJ06DRAFT_115658 [Lipomyces tetrasporus]|uniref:tRNA/rRNA methyltransferase SpoU type domain-containing protein n=1 Tax=Lipomyces tetrasporus TaxID=54092 RepID=A0AAD7QQW4_9ASCO|nr:uncharacterized protein POJ06DRAFT_115658 [Lipomyces tetrasporus]KAJ8099725.1 hypothetical protein POJ06DRAFT_115658 [Lipomyces tetrasporus]
MSTFETRKFHGPWHCDPATYQMRAQCGFQDDALKLVVGQIDVTSRVRFAHDLVQHLETADAARVDAVLALLLESDVHIHKLSTTESGELLAQTYSRLQKHAISLISGAEKEYVTARKICEVLQEQVGRQVIKKYRDTLVLQARVARTALVTEDLSFRPAAHAFVDVILATLDNDVEEHLPDTDIVHVFEFLTTLYDVPQHATVPEFEAVPDISRLGFIFQTTTDPAIARAAAKFLLTSHVLDTVLTNVSTDAVWLGLSTHLELQSTAALYFWSAVVETGYMTSDSGQAFISRSEYWLTLAKHLAGGSSERRKLCLYILERSVASVRVTIDLPGIFAFSIAQRQQLLKLWSKFITLVEITAIDTSAHQTRAATPDIQSLLQPSYPSGPRIPSLWLTCLLEMGLAASLSSVRVEIAKFLFGLGESKLKIFEREYSLLVDAFLPFIAQASFFTIEMQNDGSDVCLHGDRVSEFIERVVLAFDQPVDFVESVLWSIVDGERKTFEAHIVYVARGIWAAVRQRGDVFFNGRTCELLVRACQEIKYESVVLQSCVVGYTINILKTARKPEAADLVGSILKCRGDVEDDVNDIVEWAIKFDKKTEVEEHIKLEIKDFVLSKDETLDVGKNGLPAYRALQTKLSDMRTLISVFLRLTGELYSLQDLLKIHSSKYDKTMLVYGEFMKFALEPALKLEVDLTVGAYLTLASTFIKDHNLESLSSTFPTLPAVQPTYGFSGQQAEGLCRELVAQFENDGIFRASQGDVAIAVQMLEQLSRMELSPVLLRLPDLVNKFAELLEAEGSFDSWNVHENRQKFRHIEFVAIEIFTIVRAGITARKMSTDYSPLVKAIRNIIPNAHSQTLLSLYCEFLHEVVPKLSVDLFNDLQVFDLLMQIWTYLADGNLSVARHSAGANLIELIFHPVVLTYSTSIPENIQRLQEVAHALVPMGYARRRVLPIFANCLHIFQRDHSEVFNKNTWIASVLVELYCFQQNSANVFLIDDSVLATTHADGIEVHLLGAGIRESSARAHVVLILANLHGNNASDFGEAALAAIMASTPSLFTTAGDAASEAHRVSLVELFLLIDRYIPLAQRPTLLDMIQETLKMEFSPAVRTSLEWVLARAIYERVSDQDEKHLWVPLSNSEDKPRYLSSLLTVAVVISRTAFASGNNQRGIELLGKITPILLAFATTNRAVLRHTATSLLLGLKRYLVVLNVSQDLEDAVTILESHVLSSPTFGNFSYGDSVLWSLFEDYNLVSICGGVAARTNEQASNLRRRLRYKDFMEAIIEGENTPIAIGEPSTVSPAAICKNETMTNGTATMQDVALQTKSNTRVPTPRPVRVTNGHLIILASLVDKAPNLGGICRLADVLGAELLCIPDMNMVRNKEFQAVAVTADKWMPMKEVVEEDIPAYLHQCKRNGYSIWGVEQTDGSVLLNNELKFPKKMVLVLGKEKEGIPPQLLRELDCAVEIKQVGVVRSMNIQTATAVVVNAYAVQHC